MKYILTILLFCFSLIASGAKYYVSTTGDDSRTKVQASNILTPWLTWEKGCDEMTVDGDTLYIRGGTYPAPALRAGGFGYISAATTINGSVTDTIRILAYPGETPILDFTGLSSTSSVFGFYLYSSSYVHFRGLNFTGTTQLSGGTAPIALCAITVNNCKFELCNFYDNGGPGFTLRGVSGSHCDGNLVLNCDSYNN
jgi:hypothetical protein